MRVKILLFRKFDYCTLFIMNCNKKIYKKLSKQINLKDSIAIFETDMQNGKEEYYMIPFEYRNIDGCGGYSEINML
jgi:hypothetical protein